jgi:hypothetical protein
MTWVAEPMPFDDRLRGKLHKALNAMREANGQTKSLAPHESGRCRVRLPERLPGLRGSIGSEATDISA